MGFRGILRIENEAVVFLGWIDEPHRPDAMRSRITTSLPEEVRSGAVDLDTKTIQTRELEETGLYLFEEVERLAYDSAEILRLFVRHTPAAIAMFDTDGRYLAVSDRWYTDFGLGDESIIGRSHYDVIPDIPDRWKRAHRRALAGEVVTKDVDPFLRDDGSIIWLKWELHPWYLSGTEEIGGIILFTEVVTDRKEIELELEQRNTELYAANRELERMASDLDAFVHASSTRIADGLRTITDLSADSEGLAEVARDTLELVDKLVRYRELGTTPPQATDAGWAWAEAVKTVGLPVSRLTLDVPESWPDVFFPTDDLVLVFTNLLSNVCYHSMATTVGVQIEPVDDAWEFRVTDDGPPIPEDLHGRIFEPFFQTEGDGHGFGLALVKRAVTQLGGDVRLETGAGGNTFAFTVPLRSQT